MKINSIPTQKPPKLLTRIFLNDVNIILLIVLNSIALFIEGFSLNQQIRIVVIAIDAIITILFFIEAIVKINYFGWKNYWHSNWNKFDFILIIVALPSLFILFLQIKTELSFILIFRIFRIYRVSRIFKFFRLFKFIPQFENLLHGIKQALKTTFFVLIIFAIYNFIISILSYYLFHKVAPSEYFGDPLTSLYTMFKIFTIEGWYEVPEIISEVVSPVKALLTKVYFIIILISGGIMGMSLINSIFVDAMLTDNNEDLELKVDNLEKKIDILIESQIKLQDQLNNKDNEHKLN